MLPWYTFVVFTSKPNILAHNLSYHTIVRQIVSQNVWLTSEKYKSSMEGEDGLPTHEPLYSQEKIVAFTMYCLLYDEHCEYIHYCKFYKTSTSNGNCNVNFTLLLFTIVE